MVSHSVERARLGAERREHEIGGGLVATGCDGSKRRGSPNCARRPRRRYRERRAPDRAPPLRRPGAGTDPAVLVAETAEAIESLRPEPADLVNLCRRLVDRNPTCAPMWWFCATLLADVSALDRSWELAGRDRARPHGAAGRPRPGGRRRRGHRGVPRHRGRRARSTRRPHRARHRRRLAALTPWCAVATAPRSRPTWCPPSRRWRRSVSADVMLVEADACSPDRSSRRWARASPWPSPRRAHTPVWLVAGRGRRLPEPYRVAMERLAGVVPASRPWESEVESFPVSCVARIAGPDGVVDAAVAIVAECPFVPELIPPDS